MMNLLNSSNLTVHQQTALDAESWQQFFSIQVSQVGPETVSPAASLVGCGGANIFFLRMQKSEDVKASLIIKLSNMERMSSAVVFYVTDSTPQEKPDIDSHSIYFYSVYPSYPFGNLAEKCDLAVWPMPI